MNMKRLAYILVIALVFSAFFFVNSPPLSAKPIELKAVSFVAKDNAMNDMAVEWVKRVNEELKDQLKINFAGGPEVIPTMQQADALKSGVVDVLFTVPAYFTSLFPEGWAFFVSNYTPSEERKPGGFYDFMKEMGIVPVTLMAGDVYTALERGSVDGFGWPLLGARELGWTDKCKYIIDHPFHAPSNGIILINLNVWNKLPKEVQTKLIDVTAKYEPDMMTYFKKEYEKEWKELDKAGVKRIYFSQKEAKEYIDIIYRVDWDILTEKVPDMVPQLKKITGH
jgi:TRAP-type C4-dicarboxylate transport system substrate-binding protein